MVQQYAPPLSVSPFIRFCRWGLLFAGIAYGSMWNMRYTSYENKMRPIWEQEKKERDEYLKLEKERKAKEEVENLSKLAGGK